MDRRAWTTLLTLAALWGGSYLFIKVALDDLTPAMVTFLRIALAAAALLPLAYVKGALTPLRGHWRAISALSVVHVVAPFTLITLGGARIDSGLTGVLVASSPIFVTLLAIQFAPSERATGWGLVGVLAGIVGVLALFGSNLTGNADGAIGGGMILLASLCYAIGPLYQRRCVPQLPALTIAASTFALAAVATAPWALASGMPSAAPGADTIIALLVLGVPTTGIAFVAYYGLIAKVGAARAAIVAYIQPGFAVVYGVLAFGEAVTTGTGVGLALILAGSYLAGTGSPPWAALQRRARVVVQQVTGEFEAVSKPATLEYDVVR